MSELTKIIADILRLPESRVIAPLTMAETETWDSLRHLELVVAIETAFAIELTGDDIVSMTSLTGIEQVLAAKGVP